MIPCIPERQQDWKRNSLRPGGTGTDTGYMREEINYMKKELDSIENLIAKADTVKNMAFWRSIPIRFQKMKSPERAKSIILSVITEMF